MTASHPWADVSPTVALALRRRSVPGATVAGVVVLTRAWAVFAWAVFAWAVFAWAGLAGCERPAEEREGSQQQ